MAATKHDAMQALHATVARVLTDRMTEREVTKTDAEGNETTEVVGPSAAELAVAVKFLKDNSIFATPEQSDPVSGLKEKLSRRTGAITDADRKDALASIGRDLLN